MMQAETGTAPPAVAHNQRLDLIRKEMFDFSRSSSVNSAPPHSPYAAVPSAGSAYNQPPSTRTSTSNTSQPSSRKGSLEPFTNASYPVIFEPPAEDRAASYNAEVANQLWARSLMKRNNHTNSSTTSSTTSHKPKRAASCSSTRSNNRSSSTTSRPGSTTHASRSQSLSAGPDGYGRGKTPSHMLRMASIESVLSTGPETPFRAVVQKCVAYMEDSDPSAQNKEFVHTALLMHQWYLSSEDLFAMLVEAYYGDEIVDAGYNTASSQRRTKVAVCRILHLWATEHERIDTSLKMHFLNFEAAIKSDQDLPFGLLLEVPFTTERKSYHHKSKPQSGNSSRKQKLIDLADVPASTIAEQLTVMDFEAYGLLRPHDILMEVRDKSSAKIQAIRQHISDVSHWVAMTLLEERDLYTRASLVTRFLDISRWLKSLNNFNSLFGLALGLAHPAIARLGDTFAILSEDLRTQAADLRELVSTDNGFANYKKLYATSIEGLKDNKKLSCIPSITVLMKDIKRLNNTMDMLNKRKNINMMKMNAMALVLKEFFSHQKQSYSFTLDDAIFGALAVALRSRFSEEDLEDLSLSRQPMRAAVNTLHFEVAATRCRIQKACCGTLDDSEFARWAHSNQPPMLFLQLREAGLPVPADHEPITEADIRKLSGVMMERFTHTQTMSREFFKMLQRSLPLIGNFEDIDQSGKGQISLDDLCAYFRELQTVNMERGLPHVLEAMDGLNGAVCNYCHHAIAAGAKTAYCCSDCNYVCHAKCHIYIGNSCYVADITAADAEPPGLFGDDDEAEDERRTLLRSPEVVVAPPPDEGTMEARGTRQAGPTVPRIQPRRASVSSEEEDATDDKQQQSRQEQLEAEVARLVIENNSLHHKLAQALGAACNHCGAVPRLRASSRASLQPGLRNPSALSIGSDGGEHGGGLSGAPPKPPRPTTPTANLGVGSGRFSISRGPSAQSIYSNISGHSRASLVSSGSFRRPKPAVPARVTTITDSRTSSSESLPVSRHSQSEDHASPAASPGPSPAPSPGASPSKRFSGGSRSHRKRSSQSTNEGGNSDSITSNSSGGLLASLGRFRSRARGSAPNSGSSASIASTSSRLLGGRRRNNSATISGSGSAASGMDSPPAFTAAPRVSVIGGVVQRTDFSRKV